MFALLLAMILPEVAFAGSALRGSESNVNSSVLSLSQIGAWCGNGGGLPGTDACFIHRGCKKASYSHNAADSCGVGWYCTDGQYVDSNTVFDTCVIHKDCSCGKASFQSGVWKCDCDNHGPSCGNGGGLPGTDACFIHRGCKKAGYSHNAADSCGVGWYCTDGQYVDSNTVFDTCVIHKDCSCGKASFQSGVWKCDCDNHGPSCGNGGGLPGTDACFIHRGCKKAGYSHNAADSCGVGWYCTDGQYVNSNTDFDKCAIHKDCSCGKASFKGIDGIGLWNCDC
eukprot:TRINITY_DN3408_c0_g1_i1.p1 TRINITY_DN3408_c0_g1~~TRINITY_DN3408_c0_g1_i1.p1  ORF type:complete len:302 (-),score=60.08 TRINITY_DN3408_c0_g1_i1:224-1069(-)